MMYKSTPYNSVMQKKLDNITRRREKKKPRSGKLPASSKSMTGTDGVVVGGVSVVDVVVPGGVVIAFVDVEIVVKFTTMYRAVAIVNDTRLRTDFDAYSRADRGICERGGGRSLPFSSPLLFLSLSPLHLLPPRWKQGPFNLSGTPAGNEFGAL